MHQRTASSDIAAARRTLARALDAPDAADVAEPIRAGMRARAIVDACEAIDLPAVFIDGQGRVLHVAKAAAALLGQGLSIASGHLVATTRAENRRIESAIDTALGGEPSRSVAAGGRIAMTGIPVRDRSPYQLLRGILVLEAAAPAGMWDLTSLETLLAA